MILTSFPHKIIAKDILSITKSFLGNQRGMTHVRDIGTGLKRREKGKRDKNEIKSSVMGEWVDL